MKSQNQVAQSPQKVHVDTMASPLKDSEAAALHAEEEDAAPPTERSCCRRSRKCIIISIVVGVVVLGIAIAAAVIGALYVQGLPTSLPEDTLNCTTNCYTQAEMEELHQPYDAVLSSHVTPGMISNTVLTVVDYQSVDLSEGSDLSNYMAKLGALDLTRVPESEGLALLINAYNAFTVQVVAENIEGLTTILSLSTMPAPRTTWNTRTFNLGGFTVTLDDIEHGTIRTRYDEPRIHAAVNCASVSCPDLRPEAFTGAKLEQQLEEQMVAWMENPQKGMYLDTQNNELFLSKIFSWYGGDFSPSIEKAICKYGEGLCEYLEANDVKTSFLGYNWDLNSLASSTEVSSSLSGYLGVAPAEVQRSLESMLVTDAGVHSDFDAVLKRVVSPGAVEGVPMNVVDYSLLDGGNDPQLQSYMAWLGDADFSAMTNEEAIATLINAYNAFTLHLIASQMGNIDGFTSITDIGQPWDTWFYTVAGFNLTLNQIENGWLRPQYEEPRIHAAVNCAAKSCPDLRGEAYVAEHLDTQLDEQMKIWINSEYKGARLETDAESPVLHMSMIFNWYAVDFLPTPAEYACQFHQGDVTTPSGASLSLCEFVAEAGDDLTVEFIAYDWLLNQGVGPSTAADDKGPMMDEMPAFPAAGGTVTGGSG